jgi:hypothetical protein
VAKLPVNLPYSIGVMNIQYSFWLNIPLIPFTTPTKFASTCDRKDWYYQQECKSHRNTSQVFTFSHASSPSRQATLVSCFPLQPERRREPHQQFVDASFDSRVAYTVCCSSCHKTRRRRSSRAAQRQRGQERTRGVRRLQPTTLRGSWAKELLGKQFVNLTLKQADCE